MLDESDMRSVSKVLMRRIVLLVKVAICKYADLRAGESPEPGCALCGVEI